jgi:hypothetical protein
MDSNGLLARLLIGCSVRLHPQADAAVTREVTPQAPPEPVGEAAYAADEAALFTTKSRRETARAAAAHVRAELERSTPTPTHMLIETYKDQKKANQKACRRVAPAPVPGTEGLSEQRPSVSDGAEGEPYRERAPTLVRLQPKVCDVPMLVTGAGRADHASHLRNSGKLFPKPQLA